MMVFMGEKWLMKISGMLIRFKVIADQYINTRKKFKVIAD